MQAASHNKAKQRPEATQMRLFNLAPSSRHADMYLYGTIWAVGAGPDDVTAKAFVDELNALPPQIEEVELHINSDGGNVLQGLAMISALDAFRMRGKRIITTIEGAALSMAFVLAQAGTERRMSANALAMIHEIQGGDYGSLTTIRTAAVRMEKAQQQIVQIFARRSGRTEAEIASYMQNGSETWFSAEEAQAAGLIDVVTGSLAIAAEATRFTVPERFRRVVNHSLFKGRTMENFNQWPPLVGQPHQLQNAASPLAGPAVPAATNPQYSAGSYTPVQPQYLPQPAQAAPLQNMQPAPQAVQYQPQPAPQTVQDPPASVQDLRNAFPNASADWVLQQALSGAPLRNAAVSYAQYCEAQWRQLQAQQQQPQQPAQLSNQAMSVPQSPVAAGQVSIGVAAQAGPVNQTEGAANYRAFLNKLRDQGVAPAEAMRRAAIAMPNEMLAYQAEWQARQGHRPQPAGAM